MHVGKHLGASLSLAAFRLRFWWNHGFAVMRLRWNNGFTVFPVEVAESVVKPCGEELSCHLSAQILGACIRLRVGLGFVFAWSCGYSEIDTHQRRNHAFAFLTSAVFS